MSNCNDVLKRVQEQLQGVMDTIDELPQGYKYKVREMLSCAETVVSMYCDVQNGIIPEVLKKDEPCSTKLEIGDFKLPI